MGKDGAVYWSKQEGNLSILINELENITKEQLEELSNKAKSRIDNEYSWSKIVRKYEDLLNA